jgi:hypothetical protein|tara:strand:- start:3256 stop:3444 length:189 start_codon:yes stop_codon:yes gene_type:complete
MTTIRQELGIDTQQEVQLEAAFVEHFSQYDRAKGWQVGDVHPVSNLDLILDPTKPAYIVRTK